MLDDGAKVNEPLVHLHMQALHSFKCQSLKPIYLHDNKTVLLCDMESLPVSTRLLRKEASENDVQSATKVMHEAFQDDKFLNILLGGHNDLLLDLILSVVKAGLIGGEVCVAEDARGFIGSIVWFGPSQDLLLSEEQCNAGFNQLMNKLSSRDPDMLTWWTEYFIPTSSKFTSEAYGSPQYRRDSWYLFMIGVRPSCQRRGVGTAMVEHTEAKIRDSVDFTKESKRMTVGTDTHGALAFYTRLGFVEKGVMQLQSVAAMNEATPMWCLSKDVA